MKDFLRYQVCGLLRIYELCEYDLLALKFFLMSMSEIILLQFTLRNERQEISKVFVQVRVQIENTNISYMARAIFNAKVR